MGGGKIYIHKHNLLVRLFLLLSSYLLHLMPPQKTIKRKPCPRLHLSLSALARLLSLFSNIFCLSVFYDLTSHLTNMFYLCLQLLLSQKYKLPTIQWQKMFNFFTKLSLQKPFCTKTSQIIEASDRVFFFQKQMSEKTQGLS